MIVRFYFILISNFVLYCSGFGSYYLNNYHSSYRSWKWKVRQWQWNPLRVFKLHEDHVI